MKSKEEGLFTHFASGDLPEHPAGTYNLWMRQTFKVSKPTTISATLSVASVEASPYLRFVVLDNDTGSYTCYMLGRVNAVTMQPNTAGYTMLAYARPPKLLPPSRWSLTVICDFALDAFTTVPLTESKSFTGNYIPNKNGVLCRYTISGAQAQQLSLHVEAYRECPLVVSIRKAQIFTPPAAGVAPDMQGPQEAVIVSWPVSRIFNMPVILLPPLGGEKGEKAEKGAIGPCYLLDVRLDPSICDFTFEHNGDLAGPRVADLAWAISVASNLVVEVTQDESKEKRFRSILDAWNAKDPKGRAEAAKAALERMQQEQASGSGKVGSQVEGPPTEGGIQMRTNKAGREVPLFPAQHHLLTYSVGPGGTDRILSPEEISARDARLQEELDVDKQKFDDFKADRIAAHSSREEYAEERLQDFNVWRTDVLDSHEGWLERRDEFALTIAALEELAKPLVEEVLVEEDPKAKKDKEGDKKKKGNETPPPEEPVLSPEEKEVELQKKGLAMVNELLSKLKSSALTELKSYPHPPKNTFAVLQGVLLLLGKSAKEVSKWNACRLLINHTLVTELVEFDATISRNVKKWKQAQERFEGLDEQAIVHESVASAILFKWAMAVAKVSDAAVILRKKQEEDVLAAQLASGAE
mmetsp:Transcript_1899/g.2664  ORF Transcript_1899/g.2664 Transcript_1899/m.2664 type:complete len:639 (-) Transcript_1899:87-2003(-)